MLQKWCGYELFTMDVDEMNSEDESGEEMIKVVQEKGLETKGIEKDEGVELYESGQSSTDYEFRTASEGNEWTRIDLVANRNDTKVLDWNDMVEEYEAAEAAKLVENNNDLKDDATTSIGQRTIFSRFRRWVAKRLRRVTVCCSCSQVHGRSANHLTQVM